MPEGQITTEEKNVTETPAVEPIPEVAAPAPDATAPRIGGAPSGRRDNNKRQQGGNRRRRGGDKRPERARSEYDHKIVSIRRVARVVAGGRRFNFSVSLVAGNRKGMVGVGIGKAGDTALAIDKAMRSAKRFMVKLPLTEEGRIPHEVKAKYCASEVMIVPVPGRGLVAGSSVRTVLELGGVKDVMAKILSRSKNQLNNARAAIKALETLKA